MLYKKAISSELLKLAQKLQSIKELKGFRLVGGSALALQLGHRTSVDIDLFSDRTIDKINLPNTLSSYFPDVREMLPTSFGITCYITNMKADFCFDGGKFIRPPKKENEIIMASLEDIIAMKLNAISNRATQKDFFDIGVLTDIFSVKKMVQFYRERYPFMNVRGPIDCLKKYYLAGEENPVQPLVPLTWYEATKKIDKAYDLFIAEQKTEKQKQIEMRLKNVEKPIAKKKK